MIRESFVLRLYCSVSLYMLQVLQRKRRPSLCSPAAWSSSCSASIPSSIPVPSPTASLPTSVLIGAQPCPPSCRRLPTPASLRYWTSSSQSSLGDPRQPASPRPPPHLPLTAPPVQGRVLQTAAPPTRQVSCFSLIRWSSTGGMIHFDLREI